MATGNRRSANLIFFLLHGAGITQFCLAARSSLTFRDSSSAPHVTRLHRYEHTGLAAMLQAESAWQEVPDTVQLLGRGAEQVEGRARRRVKISSPQVEWLQQHHSLVRMSSKSNAAGASYLREAGQHRAAAVHAAQGKATGDVATGLSNLGSQYVGPVGIGTVTLPQGCSPKDGASLVYLPPGSAAANSKLQQECHAVSQAEVFMVFDTGSTNIWVSSDLCKEGACTNLDRVRYNHSLSQTFKPINSGAEVMVQFGTGAVQGPQAVDDIHIGPFTVYNQTFGMIQKEEGSIFKEVPFEGILGLALPEMSFGGAIPFFDNVVKQKSLKRNAFSFYFSLDNPSANAVFWGGADSKFHKGPVEFFKVKDNFYWSLDMKSFKIGDQELLGAGAAKEKSGNSVLLQSSTPKAIVDTGTTFFTAGTEIFNKLLDKLPNSLCSKMTEESHPPLLIQMESVSGKVHDFKLSHDQYMVSSDSSDIWCMPAFMQLDLPQDHGPGIILGEVFLRHYYSVFDRGNGGMEDARVGLATAAHGENVDRHLKALTKHQPTFAEARKARM